MKILQTDKTDELYGPVTGAVNEDLIEKVEPVSPPILETVGAAFRLENPLSSISVKVPGQGTGIISDPDYDRISPVRGTKYFDLPGWEYQNNDEQMNAWKMQADSELQARETLSNAGVLGTVTSIAAGTLDPLTIWAPGMIGLKTAARIAGGAASISASAVAQEKILANTQAVREDRTLETATVGAILGGILGGVTGAKALSSTLRSDLETNIREVVKGSTPVGEVSSSFKSSANSESLSAAKVDTAEGINIADLDPLVIKALTGGIDALQSPVVAGLTSANAHVRNFTHRAFSSLIGLDKHKAGYVTDETISESIALSISESAKVTHSINNLYRGYANVSDSLVGDAKAYIAGRQGKHLSHEEFNQQVGLTLVSGNFNHALAQVNDAARIARAQINKVAAELHESGVFSKEFTSDEIATYFSRTINKDNFVKNRGYLISEFEKHIALDAEKAKVRVSELTAELASATDKQLIKQLKADIKGYKKHADVAGNVDGIRSAAKKAYNNYLGVGESSSLIGQVGIHATGKSSSKFTKARVFNIPDEVFDKVGAMNRNASTMIANYTHQSHAMIALKRVLGNMNVQSLAELKQNIVKDASKAADLLVAQGKPADLKAHLQMEKDIQMIDDFAKVVLGQYGTKTAYDGALKNVRKYNMVRLLGNVALNSIPEIAMQLTRKNAIVSGMLPIAKSISKFNIATDQLRDLALFAEMHNDNMLAQLTDPATVLTKSTSKFDATLDALFGKVTGLQYWTNFGRRMAAHVSFSNIMRIGKGELADTNFRMKALGLSDGDLKYITAQYKLHGEDLNGSHVGNFDDWDVSTPANAAHLRALSVAIRRDVQSVVVTPEVGDIPLVAQRSELAKVFFQFKPFMAGVTTKQLIPNMQQRDINVYLAYSTAISMGILVEAINAKLKGNEYNPTAQQAALDGITRSGVGGLVMTTAIGALGGSSKFAGQNAISTIGGPTVGLVQDVFSSGAAIKDRLFSPDKPELTSGDLKKMRHLIPLQNLHLIRVLEAKGDK